VCFALINLRGRLKVKVKAGVHSRNNGTNDEPNPLMAKPLISYNNQIGNSGRIAEAVAEGILSV